MPPRSPWSCILWDVDGTLVDASDGILQRLTRTLDHFGHPEPTRAELVHWIGPPMHESFQKNLGMSPDQAAEAVTYFRALGDVDGHTGGARTYPGMVELVADLAAAGVAQATASSKPEPQVVALMEHFGLAPHLQATAGASADEQTMAAKSDIVAEALRRLDALGLNTDRAVLVGDRHHDVEGGRDNDVPVIFVRWGFSWPHESEGAQAVVDTVDQLRALLLVDAD
ncbi:HAD hydrolase-like protein [Microbacterium sp.]|uniref:HAD hydrolase-like protein n=1 Tax=Microbacterium sp. TaxID=51671 RepID=UPI0039E424B8